MFKKKFTRPPTTLLRSGRLSDLKLVCQDGVTYAHQFVLERHSPLLKKFFTAQSIFVGVTLNQPRVKGLPPTLKVEREPSPLVQLHLPGYTLLTVNLLLDLLYTGKTSQLGELDENRGQLSIRLLYEDLGIDPEFGGLPDISELETLEVDRVKDKEVKIVVLDDIVTKEEVKEVPLVEIATSTTTLETVNEVEVVANSRSNVETLTVSDNGREGEESENMCVDVDELLSGDEIELDDDDESLGKNVYLVNLRESNVEDDSKRSERKEETNDWEVDLLDTSFEFSELENEKSIGVKARGRRPSLNLVKKTQLQIQPSKTANEFRATSSDEKKRKCFDDEDYLPPKKLMASKGVKARKIARRSKSTVNAAIDDPTEISYENKKAIDSIHVRNEINTKGSISDCFKKLCSVKLKNEEFNFPTISFNTAKFEKSKSEEPSSSSQNDDVTGQTFMAGLKLRRNSTHIQKLKCKDKKSYSENLRETLAKYVCPIKECSRKNASATNFDHGIFHFLKHLVSHHLRKDPCQIYKDLEAGFSSKDLRCSSCTFSTQSKTFLLTHMAHKHGDLYHRLRKYRRKATTKKELDIYSRIHDYLKKQKEWKDWKMSNPSPDSSTSECTLNQTVNNYCRLCDEIFTTWSELRAHVLTKHCSNTLELYISGCEGAGYECEAASCSFKVKDKMDILDHLASRDHDHSILSDKEIADIAEGKGEIMFNPDCKDSNNKADSSSSNDVTNDEIKMSKSKNNGKCGNINNVVMVNDEVEEKDVNLNCKDSKADSVVPVEIANEINDIKSSPKEHVSSRRKIRAESFELFGSPLQILKDPPHPPAAKSRISKNRSNSESNKKEILVADPKPTNEIEMEDSSLKKYQCNFCIYDYVGDDDLREHLLEDHADKFKDIPLLEGGEKFYECGHCFKKTKVKLFHMRHLKTHHKMITLDLVKSIEDWKTGGVSFKDFCTERDENWGYILQLNTVEAKPEQVQESCSPKLRKKSPIRSPRAKHVVPVPDLGPEIRTDQPVVETITDESCDSIVCCEEKEEEEGERSPEIIISEEMDPNYEKSEIDHVENNEIVKHVEDKEIVKHVEDMDIVTHVENKEIVKHVEDKEIVKHVEDKEIVKHVEDNGIVKSSQCFEKDIISDDEVIEEFVSLAKRKPLKLKPRTPKEFVCQVCDRVFASGPKVSAHVFMMHLQVMTDTVWKELYDEDKTCFICDASTERTILAKLHQYSQHKRELKKKMEEKGLDWRNLLDYIQYGVSEDMINEEDVTESSEVESRNGSVNEVSNNPFYTDQSVVVSSSSPTGKDDAPSKDSQEKASLHNNPEPPPSQSCENPIKESVTSKVAIKKVADESDSDDGIQVMESRSVNTKKAVSVPIVDKSEPEESPHPKCPHIKCNEIFNDMNGLVDHYTTVHPQSPLKLWIIKCLAPDRVNISAKSKLETETVSLMGEVKVLLPCTKCEMKFTELQVLTRHVTRHSDSSAAQCEHCRNFVKVGEREQHQAVCLHRGELQRIDVLKSRVKVTECKTPIVKLYPCTHRLVGCEEAFSDKKLLHDHARKCRHRPSTSYSCHHPGCTKRYYYEADYERHVAKFHPPALKLNQ